MHAATMRCPAVVVHARSDSAEEQVLSPLDRARQALEADTLDKSLMVHQRQMMGWQQLQQGMLTECWQASSWPGAAQVCMLPCLDDAAGGVASRAGGRAV